MAEKFILVHLIPPDQRPEDADNELQELVALVTTYGGATVVKIMQKRDHPDNETYIGKGKAEELKISAKEEKAQVVVLNGIVKQGQIFSLQRYLTDGKEDVAVWDRMDLILNIFAKHASTAEAKLQIELARMRHMGPRMYGLGGNELSRQGGGIGTRGKGETNIEIMKRHWREQIKQTQDRLKKLTTEREKQIARRKELGLKTVSIVGYTNAGKTSLFNLLSKKRKLVENALFATLDSTVGELYVPSLNSTVIISDTIGFIQNLPPQLIDAFKSTLMESVHAHILLHIIDISDEKREEKIEIVEQILADLKVENKKRIFVFNKIDAVENLEEITYQLHQKYSDYNPIFISVHNKQNIESLIEKISRYI